MITLKNEKKNSVSLFLFYIIIFLNADSKVFGMILIVLSYYLYPPLLPPQNRANLMPEVSELPR